jgi:hypothetical protein
MPSSSITNLAAHGAPSWAAFAVRAHIKENPLAPAMVSQEEHRRTRRAAGGAGTGGSFTT